MRECHSRIEGSVGLLCSWVSQRAYRDQLDATLSIKIAGMLGRSPSSLVVCGMLRYRGFI